ncbi:MAG: GNAT family N-acetyltransferase [Rhizobiaceae bacterium]|jgi:GNAT superfamily N-acetyltransferase|nr:GNAT family N-acetyltransferase [Rhizobiaceae bacterium]
MPHLSAESLAPVTVRPFARGEFDTHFDAIAALRITVFREWPYLYDGDLAYERSYLSAYMEAPGAVIIGAFDGKTLIGAATAAPLADHHAAFSGPLAASGLAPTDYFYFGESVLLPAFRGRGVGVRFFEEREAAARTQGFSATLFTAVIRPANHPARPADYVPLDTFWTRRGYARIPGLATTFSWRDVGEAEETPKPMEFWRRSLTV